MEELKDLINSAKLGDLTAVDKILKRYNSFIFAEMYSNNVIDTDLCYKKVTEELINTINYFEI